MAWFMGMSSSKYDQIYLQMREKVAQFLGSEKGASQPWAQVLLAGPDLFRLLVKLMRDKRVPRRHKLKLWAAVAYTLSPIDLVPAFLFGPLGLLDNVAVIAYPLNSVINDIDPAIV